MIMTCCHDDQCAATPPLNSSSWRRALWIALVVNAGFFLTDYWLRVFRPLVFACNALKIRHLARAS
jgi:hypothetical protein